MRGRPARASGERLVLAGIGIGIGACVVALAVYAQTAPSTERAASEASEAVRHYPYGSPLRWWDPGSGRVLAAFEEYETPSGSIGIINTAGPIDTKGHPFFEPVGENGRACVTCHQPSDGMSLSVATIQERWRETQGQDPLFAAIDGKNCPHLPQGDEASHSLLLERGLFRIFLPWPPRSADGTPIEPEFSIEVVRDPTGCNTHPEHGLDSDEPTISVYRRPRVAGNLRYVVAGGSLFNIKDGSPMDKDPETGEPVSMQLMADARTPTLKTQALDAAHTHLEIASALTDEQLERIRDFEEQIYVAMSHHRAAGRLTGAGTPTALGPDAMANGEPGLGDNFRSPVFGSFEAWREPRPGETPEQRAFRESVIRGHDVFFVRPFWIRDVTHLNTVGLGNPIKRSCATCHNAILTGMDLAPGWMDLGTTTMPWAHVANDVFRTERPWDHAFDLSTAEHGAAEKRADERLAELPLFKLTCKPSAMPHPYLGREIYTNDPGRALITGRCRDIGAITIQQMRGLDARAPYFSNGAARTLEELVEYYDRRFDAQYSEQEKRDLVNFLSVL